MNQERIFELAKQADPDHWHSRWCSGINPRVMDPEIKKLAELIVRECALTLYKNAVQDKQAGFAHEAKIMELAGDIVKQHFGVQ